MRSPPGCSLMSKAQEFGCAVRTAGPAGAQRCVREMDPDAQIENLRTACRFAIREHDWYARYTVHYDSVVYARPSDMHGLPPLGCMFSSSRTPKVL